MAREKKPPEQKAGCPEWLATYGDLVTLVLTFFVLLFSFSTIDAQKWKSVVETFSGNPSIFDGLDYSANPVAENMYKPGAEQLEVDLEYLMTNSDTWDQIVAAVQNILAQANEDGTSTAQMTHDAQQIRIELSGDVLFDSGSDKLRVENLDVLIDVIEEIRPYLPIIGFIVIEGHTDNVPINTARFPSNWELSQGRSASVLRYLLEGPLKDDPDFTPGLFDVAGYGEYHPLDPTIDNNTPEARQQNRRVTFRIDKSPDFSTDTPQTVSPDDIP